ncbi:MAG: hypothetical protein K2G51_02250, partial [Lachnospiraceae bacterium]|nr:hypothetical protein [Lachnospiraceae bacterium]
DTGACNICGNAIQSFVNTLGNRLKAVILRDNDGHNNALLLPFTCAYREGTVTDWMGLIRGLRDIGFQGELIVDFTDTLAAFSPLIRPALFRLAREVGDPVLTAFPDVMKADVLGFIANIGRYFSGALAEKNLQESINTL